MNPTTPTPDHLNTARQALACLDLTSLADGHDQAGGERDVEQLCARADGRFGRTAAVCVWPRLAGLARSLLPPAIRVAAVANFPDGSSDIARAVREAAAIASAGAQEVDVVIPYHDLGAAPALLAAVRRECEGLTLKVILETGELADNALINRAAQIALDAGADFLKTSTGKRPVSATPASARLLLQTIAAASPAQRAHVGFKPAGGIRTVTDAAVYLALTAEWLGPDAVTPARFRIGASGLLDDIEAVLAGAPRPAAGSAY
ncbi:deoxyribose-phosphate aldolase [Hydrogenophaga sp. A37]|uniref:deoxyribose-phosphate aldolase n=1 Tax=Hydrogenophaga sp. A37 TaxID=1945864 RepID=UPI0009865DF1|nr:deoxyribose-phosphate aldolase [Hydrogenophaga sp. A37]OOG84324.1 deoxyribose-phosphate aldolase [Hydrogenophaga sp. A37]